MIKEMGQGQSGRASLKGVVTFDRCLKDKKLLATQSSGRKTSSRDGGRGIINATVLNQDRPEHSKYPINMVSYYRGQIIVYSIPKLNSWFCLIL